MKHTGGIVILDFGSQFTQLIARRLREMNVYCEIWPFDVPIERIKTFQPKGIVLSGGPSSVTDEGSPDRDVKELLGIAPLLGICYGMQLIAQQLGGRVKPSGHREYGLKKIIWTEQISSQNLSSADNLAFEKSSASEKSSVGQNLSSVEKSSERISSASSCTIPLEHNVWMSHGDVVDLAPPGFVIHGKSETGAAASMRGDRVLAFQFHPEVTHTEFGKDLLKYFVFDMCKATADWNPTHIVEQLLVDVRARIPAGETVLCALSGGVDSTVVGTLLTKALGASRVKCIFVNNGLLRKNEFADVIEIYKRLGLNVLGVDATKEFLSELAGVEDPEKKRKIIGRVFLEVFESHINLKEVQWLAQGTLYPDVIESVNVRGASVTIKTHHNVGGLPANMKLKLLEPLRELFKDEVREIGKHLGIPQDILWRHPFPGPGLAIRVIGDITEDDLRVLRDVDAVYIDELKKNGLYDKIWQAFCVLLPIKSVGVQGDSRSYERVVAVRAVVSHDGMTADWYEFSPAFLKKVSNRITNEVREVNRVVYDITSKPPATIEWE